MWELRSDQEVYCWLKLQLEPRLRVEAEHHPPCSAQRFHYLIRDGDVLLAELRGDFCRLVPGELQEQARRMVAQLRQLVGSAAGESGGPRAAAAQPGPCAAPGAAAGAALSNVWYRAGEPLIAGQLPPRRTDRTYFSTGRAALIWLLQQVCPRRLWLPTYCAGSVITAVHERLPGIELRFYVVDRLLRWSCPAAVEPGDAVLVIHYFGQLAQVPQPPEGCCVLEDLTHVLLPPPLLPGHQAFGSLRKVLRLADGGFVCGAHNPCYEADRHLAAWLRQEARDWRDLREAEHLLDRDWKLSDISSQSLAALHRYDLRGTAVQRQQADAFLQQHFPMGRPLLQFGPHEVPLLHNRVLDSVQQRDQLQARLAAQGIYCGVHWPVHELLLQRQEQTDITDATWLAEHVLSIPLTDELDLRQLERICRAARQ